MLNSHIALIKNKIKKNIIRMALIFTPAPKLTDDAKVIFKKMVSCSGPHINIKNSTNRDRDGKDLYATFHHEKFSIPHRNALRNTLVRLSEFQVADSLEGVSVIEFGSNIGAISIELATRGCDSVIGFEYVPERVAVSNELAQYLGLSNCVFRQADLNSFSAEEFLDRYKPADIVVCCAVDAYIHEPDKLYYLLSVSCKSVCLFESNAKIGIDMLTEKLSAVGFDIVKNIGVSRSDPGFGRTSFILSKL